MLLARRPPPSPSASISAITNLCSRCRSARSLGGTYSNRPLPVRWKESHHARSITVFSHSKILPLSEDFIHNTICSPVRSYATGRKPNQPNNNNHHKPNNRKKNNHREREQRTTFEDPDTLAAEGSAVVAPDLLDQEADGYFSQFEEDMPPFRSQELQKLHEKLYSENEQLHQQQNMSLQLEDQRKNLVQKVEDQRDKVQRLSATLGQLQKELRELQEDLKRSEVDLQRNEQSIETRRNEIGQIQSQIEREQLIETELTTTFQKLQYLIQQEHIQEALKFFQHLRQSRSISVRHYQVVLDYFCKRGAPERMVQYFEDMRFMGITPNIYTFVTMFNGLRAAEDVDSFFHYFQLMKEEYHITPDTKFYNALILLLGERGDARMLEIYADMRNNGIPANINTYRYMIEAFGLQKNIMRSFQIDSSIKSKQGLQTFLQVFDGDKPPHTSNPQQVGKNNKSIKIVPSSANVPVHNRVSALAYSTVAGPSPVYQVTDLMMIGDCIEQMKLEGIKLTEGVVQTILRSYAKYGDLGRMMGLYHRLKTEITPNSMMLFVMLNGCVAKGDWYRFEECIEEIRALDVPVDRMLYSKILEGFAKKGDFDRMIQYFESLMKTGNTQPDDFTFTRIFNGLSVHGNSEHIKHFLEYWEKIIENYNIRFTSRNVTKTLDLIAKFGTLEQLERWMKKFDEADFDETTWTALINHHSHTRQFPQAVAIFKKVLAKGIASDVTYTVFIDACGWNNERDYLDLIVNNITWKYLGKTFPAYRTQLDPSSKQQQQDLQRLPISDLPLSLNMLNSLIEAYARLDHFKQAIILFDILDQLAQHFKAIGDSRMQTELCITPKTCLSMLGLMEKKIRTDESFFGASFAQEISPQLSLWQALYHKNITIVSEKLLPPFRDFLHRTLAELERKPPQSKNKFLSQTRHQ